MCRIWQMKRGKYAKTPAKIQVRRIFRTGGIGRNVLSKFRSFYRDCYGDTILVPIRIGTNMAEGNQQKHLLPSFAVAIN